MNPILSATLWGLGYGLICGCAAGFLIGTRNGIALKKMNPGPNRMPEYVAGPYSVDVTLYERNGMKDQNLMDFGDDFQSARVVFDTLSSSMDLFQAAKDRKERDGKSKN